MNKRKVLFLLATALILVHLPLQSQERPAIRVQRLSDRLAVFTEESRMENNIIAVETSKGLVVVDATGSPANAEAMRRKIVETFDRNDVVYLINTHHHWDHAWGNQVFNDAQIIGHKMCLERMKLDFESRAGRVPQGFVPTYPTKTFEDELTLNLGDVRINLIYFGRAHSGADIFIHIPKEHALLTGDVFLDRGWLPLFSGQPDLDIPRWISVLEKLLDGKDSIGYVIPAHREVWPKEKLVLWRDYIVELWNEVRSASKEGLTVDAVVARFPLKERYKYPRSLGHSDKDLEEFHVRNIGAFWRQLAR